MAKVDYSGRIADGYRAGRRLPPESISSWMDAIARHLGRIGLRADSTLELLSDEDFAVGMARLEAAAAAETSPGPVREALELVVFA